MSTQRIPQLESPPPPDPRVQAGGIRRGLHALLAAGGWLVFLWWWWIVLRRVTEAEVRFSLIFLAVSLVVIVATTAIWVLHNLSIFRRKPARETVRERLHGPLVDARGRELRFEDGLKRARVAPVVRVNVSARIKHYHAGGA